ncbi:hypothetical protein [Pseudomonas sp. DP-17]|uniref:hypothetical protein n=1 Tax=Pseudomonas sp. DP-17 TaxID=1580486 RepID=UPI001EFA4F42|nr:hypothetical protein [Pseudomonas sp. DP-17]MCG8911029.1 hypothetical protein [Pseudomonas sp. DP-17]
MSGGYYPDHDYELRRLNEDDGLDPIPAYYLRGRDLFRAQQLLPSNPVCRFEGSPVGHVELNNSLEPFRVMSGPHPLGTIELADGIYTTVDGQRYLLRAIQL